MEVVTMQMARYLSANGVTVRFFTRRNRSKTDTYKKFLEYQSKTLQVLEVQVDLDTPRPDGSWSTFYRISCDFGLSAQPYYAQCADTDVFVAHLSVDLLFIPKNAKSLLHLHGSPDKIDPLMEAAIQIPDRTIAHSNSISNWWNSHFQNLKPSIFQNGIDTDYFTGNVASERPIDILYVGRFMEHKGVDTLLRAASDTQNIVIAGSGPHLPLLKKLTYQLNLTDSITFYDSPSTEHIAQLYRQAKIFACPSKGKEGVLTTLLEAGASGCAVITTSGSGMTDLIEDGRNGIVIRPNDIEALQQNILRLLNEPSTRLRLAESLQNELRESWSWNVKIVELKKLYDTLL